VFPEKDMFSREISCVPLAKPAQGMTESTLIGEQVMIKPFPRWLHLGFHMEVFAT
jgi:hypothetical protein